MRELLYWTEHAAFMDQIFDDGVVVLGGPFTDETGSIVIVEAENEHEVADLFARDPFAVQGAFAINGLKQWQLFLMHAVNHR